MSLRYAVLASLLDGDATGYELAKRFDASVANFWHALPQQIYGELARMEDDGLVAGEVVVQSARPNKRVFRITEAGRRALADWIDVPVKHRSLKSEILVKMYAADLADAASALAALERYLPQHRAQLERYLALREAMLHGRGEEDFLRTAHRIGPYLALTRGIAYERGNVEWAEWAIATLRERTRLHPEPPAGGG
jgi:DNA-binding PadR family transcriptional regulator